MNNPCRNGGVCNTAANTAEGYICVCQRGYEGVNCEQGNKSNKPIPIYAFTILCAIV